MRKSTMILALTLLSPALLVGCSNSNCDEDDEDCRSSSGRYYGGVHTIRSGSHMIGVGSSHGIGGTARGGFGGFGGAHGMGG